MGVKKLYGGIMSNQLKISSLIFIFILLVQFNSFSQKTVINPQINLEDGIKFVYYNNYAKEVYLKSSFDQWKLKYEFKKKISIKGIWDGHWELLLPISYEQFQLRKGTYKYKLIVDGEFIADPFNPNTVDDEMGFKISQFEIKQDLIDYNIETNPKLVKDTKNVWRFIYKNYQAKSVYLSGDFNQWNAYADQFVYIGDGTWEIKKKLAPGKYYYNFIVDDKWIKDPLNTNVARNVLGRAYSSFEAKGINED